MSKTDYYCEFCYGEHTLPLCTSPHVSLEDRLSQLAEAINEIKDVLVDAIAKKESEASKVTPDDLVAIVQEWIEEHKAGQA